MVAATADLDASGTIWSPVAETMVTAFVSASKPASAREMSLATMRSALFRPSFSRPRATGSPLSAAKPTSTGLESEPLAFPSCSRISVVLTSRSSSGSAPFSIFPSAGATGV